MFNSKWQNIYAVKVHVSYHPEIKSNCMKPSNLSQPDKNWNWFLKLPQLPNWFRKKPTVYARSLMVTNYQNLKNKSDLGKLKCLPVYLFRGSLLAHLAGWAAELHRHSHTPRKAGGCNSAPGTSGQDLDLGDLREKLSARASKLKSGFPVTTQHKRCSRSL